MNNRAGLALCFLLLGLPTVSPAADRVLLISWDGVRRDVLRELIEWQPLGAKAEVCPNANRPGKLPVPCGQWLTCMPNLCSFQLIESLDVEGKPLTKPQHAQILTGYGPQETGDITNSGIVSVPEGMTIYERLAAARPDVMTAHLAGLKYIGRSVVGHALDTGALKLILRRGSYDKPRFTGANTTERATEGLDFLYGSPAFFFFVHYKTADVVGHRSGDKSRAYREAIIANDDQLGRLLDQMSDRELLEGTRVYVTTDHGFDGNFHVNLENESVRNTWIASRQFDLLDEPATTLDVTPTVLDVFGIDARRLTPAYRGRSLLRH